LHEDLVEAFVQQIYIFLHFKVTGLFYDSATLNLYIIIFYKLYWICGEKRRNYFKWQFFELSSLTSQPKILHAIKNLKVKFLRIIFIYQEAVKCSH